MSDFKANTVISTTPLNTTTGPDDRLIVLTPIWCTVVRGFQIFFAFLILALSGIIIHGLAFDAVVFSLVCGFFTWIVAIYALVSEKAINCRAAYNIWAILALDLLMAIFWLSSMGAVAALRGTFTVPVDASCYSDGSTINSGHCTINGRSTRLGKRVAILTAAGEAEMSAIAGLSALMMLLHIATLVYNGHTFRIHHQTNSPSKDNAHVEMKAQAAPMLNPQPPAPGNFPQYHEQQQYQPQYQQQQQQQQQQAPPPSQTPQPFDAHSYGYPPHVQAQAGPPQPQPQAYPQEQAYPQGQAYPPHHTPSPAPQAYEAPATAYARDQGPYEAPQSPYSVHSTPAHAQPPYQPPQH